MAQVSNRNETGKPGDNGKEQTDKIRNLVGKGTEAAEKATEESADALRDVSDQARASTARVVHGATSTMERATGVATEFARSAVESSPAAREALKAETEVASLWMSLTRDQLEHNVETMRRLTTVRDLRELLELQGEFVRVSMSRAAQGMMRQVDLAGRMIMVGAQSANRPS